MGAPLEFLFQLDAKIDGQLKMLASLDASVKKLGAQDKATDAHLLKRDIKLRV